jgi:outer membrane protein TolC
VAVLKPRERLVYFRVSEDEFRQFVSVCEQAGARSVSDLARNAVQRLIADANRQREEDEVAQKMHTLEKLISEVTDQLQLLLSTQNNVPALDQLTQGALLCSSGHHSAEKNGRGDK